MTKRTDPSSRSQQGTDVDGENLAETLAALQIGGDAGRGTTLDSGEPAVHCAVHVPTAYEAGYAYPLIVWFHDEGSDEQELLGIMPHLNGRNYAGLSLRGPLPVTNGLPRQRRWSLADSYLNLLEEELAVSLHDTAERLNVHRDRIVVAGMGQGATLALRMLLRRPDWFAGAVCLNAQWAAGNRLEWWGQYINKPLWLGHIHDWTPAPSAAAVRYARLLRSAGIDVTAHLTEFGDAKPAQLGAAIDRWLMQSLCPRTVVT